MPIPLPESVKKVLEDKAYGHVVTFNANGRPQVTMVWIDVEGNEALFNTAEGRKKPQNLKARPSDHHLGSEPCGAAVVSRPPRERDGDGDGRRRPRRQARETVSRG